MATSLYDSGNIEQWKQSLDLYEDVLALKASQRKSGSKDLLQLDSWFQNELPKLLDNREEKFLTLEELTKLMKWKLTRGKFRPRLSELVQTNNEKFVEECTKKAFQLLPNISAAITEASKLKAVGPATASAILCTGAPDIPFMADESIMAIPGLGKPDYNLKFYKQYFEKVTDCAERLQLADPAGEWTAHKVELALWTHFMATKLKPELLEKPSETNKRKHTEEQKHTKSKKSKP